MLPVYKLSINKQCNKYYEIGYKSYFANVPRDLADDLSFSDRPSFLHGWDTARQEHLNKSPRTPRPVIKG